MILKEKEVGVNKFQITRNFVGYDQSSHLSEPGNQAQTLTPKVLCNGCDRVHVMSLIVKFGLIAIAHLNESSVSD
jgi:hypothetical protein